VTSDRDVTKLRSQRWYGGEGVRGFSHRARTRQMGIAAEEHQGKPVIGIVNTWSEINPCHLHLRDRAEAVKRGVWQAGGYPIELPASAIAGETFTKPSAMLYRNLLSMEVEELIRSYPVDGVVLLGGCDKTTPALLMGAISADLPAIFVPAGPMLRGNWRGEVLGSGSDMWRYWDDRRAGLVDDQQWAELEEGIARVRCPGEETTGQARYSILHVREDGGWRMASQLSAPTPSLAFWPSNTRKKQSARGRYINEPLIAPLDPRHHPSIHPPINGSQGGRSLAWLRSLAKLLR